MFSICDLRLFSCRKCTSVSFPLIVLWCLLLICFALLFVVSYIILLLVYKALNVLGPKCISDLLVRYEAPRPLRSSRAGLLSVPRIKTKQGEAAFSFYAPRLWNKLPEYLRSAETVSSFKSGLKTLLFATVYQ